MHEQAQAAPVLVQEGLKAVNKRIQSHALCECMAEFRKKSEIFGDVFATVIPLSNIWSEYDSYKLSLSYFEYLIAPIAQKSGEHLLKSL